LRYFSRKRFRFLKQQNPFLPRFLLRLSFSKKNLGGEEQKEMPYPQVLHLIKIAVINAVINAVIKFKISFLRKLN